MRRASLLPLLSLLTSVACGDDASGAGGATGSGGASSTSSASTTAASSASGTTGPGGSTADGGGGTAGEGGSAGAGGSPLVADCSGDWDTAAETVLAFEAEDSPQGVAVSRGELELHFALRRSGFSRAVLVRSVRSSVDDPFPPPVLAPDLDDLCDGESDPYLDVSEDGLRAYVTCAAIGVGVDPCPMTGCEILLAERSTPMLSFELVGVVGRAGFHPSLRADELVVVTNGLVAAEGTHPRMAERDALAEDFGPALEVDVPVGGFSTVSGATLSNDGLELYAFAKAVPAEPGLARATRARPTDPFGAFEPVGVWTDPPLAAGAPDLTPDCRSMYVVRQAEGGNGIDVLRR